MREIIDKCKINRNLLAEKTEKMYGFNGVLSEKEISDKIAKLSNSNLSTLENFQYWAYYIKDTGRMISVSNSYDSELDEIANKPNSIFCYKKVTLKIER